MVRNIYESFGNEAKITLKYDSNNPHDKRMIKIIKYLVSQTQDTCFNCDNYETVGCLGGYQAASCKIHGILECLDNPHHDCDGTKCKDYKRKYELDIPIFTI